MKKPQLIILISILIVSAIIFVIAQNTEPMIIPACCASEDGYCKDIGVKVGESGCGSEYDKYTFISNEKFCNRLSEECVLPGKCYIRGKLQEKPKQYYACVALCKESGECECSGDLTTCTGDFDWVP